MSPWCQGTARDVAKMIPMLEDVEDKANQISWLEEMMCFLLEAMDKLEGPQGEGEGDIEYMTTSSHQPSCCYTQLSSHMRHTTTSHLLPDDNPTEALYC